jgi:hypothetical protein
VHTSTRTAALRQLRRAFLDARVTLFLGAGCSVGSGVPPWERLVVQLYINGIVRRLGRYQRVPGLVASVGHWAFGRQAVPLEVAARGLKSYYLSDNDFVQMMRIMLYGLTGLQQWSRPRPAAIRKILRKNSTLRAVAQLCRRSVAGKRGVHSVITYNYDDLLEWLLVGRCQPVWRATSLRPRQLPIYHVHGFVPLQDGEGSRLDEIVLSEDQYNRAAQDPYTWNNLVQMQALSQSVGLMIGLSLTDRNLRRILDNLRAMPSRTQSYALLRRPSPWKVEDHDVDSILANMKDRVHTGFEIGYDEQALAALERPEIRKAILRMIGDLETLDARRAETTLSELGVTVLWYEDHREIPELVQRMMPHQDRE